MITLSVTVPTSVAAQFFDAAEQLNDHFKGLSPQIEAHTLMAFVLARHDSHDLCAQFELALRAVRSIDVPPLANPVLN